jgi:hypothetical protein
MAIQNNKPNPLGTNEQVMRNKREALKVTKEINDTTRDIKRFIENQKKELLKKLDVASKKRMNELAQVQKQINDELRLVAPSFDKISREYIPKLNELKIQPLLEVNELDSKRQ